MNTSKHSIDLTLIQSAQQDQEDSRSLLTELTEQIVYPYVYRLTFDYHLAQDICQETLIEMLKSLPKLDYPSAKSYCAWVYRTALSKVQRHYRQQGRQRRFTMSSQSTFYGVSQNEATTTSDQVDRLVNKELFDAAVRAMKSLKLTYRNILTLRCFDGLSYEEIALIDGSSQLACRLRFYKAKKALKQQLARRGFNRSYLLPALTLIGTVTWPKTVSTATASSPVIASALHVSKTTALIGLVCSKMVAITAISIIVAGTTVGLIHSNTPSPSIQSHTDFKALITQGRLACPHCRTGHP
jgi:RNA polymerase sigma-70 factor (ECF subfamily)